jgi:serine/threonine protein kinase/Flp pilus assembly protein TadD
MEQLGRYRLSARIATGGMAEVFLARSEGVQGFSRSVVIKRLLPHLSRDPSVVEMFLNEARLTGRLDHPNIVQVLDLGEDHGSYYIAMEFLDGRALSEVRDAARSQGGMLPTAFTLKVFSEALGGLHNAHEARTDDGTPLQIVHRDFNPDNIVVTYDGRVKVVDFGIAKAQVAASSTEPGTLKGKYFYMSPEMVLGNPLDRRADIFAVGVSLYELLCDKRPFEGDTPNAILSGIAYGKAVAPHAVNPTLSPEIEALINHCMERTPELRPPTALAVKLDIDRLLTYEAPCGQPEIAQMMEQLFPNGRDAERSRITELRQLDPSTPSTASPFINQSEPKARDDRKSESTGSNKKPPVKLKALTGPLLNSATTARLKKLGPLALVPVAGIALIAVIVTFVVPKIFKPDPKEVQLKEQRKDCEAHPEDANICLRYAETLQSMGKPTESIEEVVAKVLTAHPDAARAHSMMGDLLLKKRFGSKAEEEYNKALKLNPKDATTWEHIGDLSLGRVDIPSACEQYQKAHELKPHDVPLALKLADALGHSGEWEKVISLLAAMVSQKPSDPDLRTALAFAYMQMKDAQGLAKDLPKALSELQAAEKLRPTGCKTQSLLGVIYFNQGQAQKASEAYKSAVTNCTSGPGANNQDLAVAHVGLCQLLKETNRAEAKKECEAAIKADPTVPDAPSLLKTLQ